jgi:hypothetical protein
MLYALLISIALSLLFLVSWQKAKADNSFLEGKVADLLEREARLLKVRDLQKQGDHPAISFPSYTQVAALSPKKSTIVPDTSWIPGEADPEDPDVVEDPKELQIAALGNVTMAFLKRIGAAPAETEDTDEIAAVDPEPDSTIVEQVCFFEESDVTQLSSQPSLDKPGLHYWVGVIEQKFSDDFATITNGMFKYHLSYEKITQFAEGDKVCMQVLVNEEKNREILMVWPAEESILPLTDVAIPA